MHAFGEWLQATPLSVMIQSVTWIIPLLQSIHIVMIGVVFVSSVMISLRVLGRVRPDEPFADVWQRFAPWMWNGLVVMLVTGLILTLGEPEREFGALSFWLKMGLLVVAVVTTGVFGRAFAGAANASTAAGTEFSGGSKAIAITTIVIWLAIIFLGRAIAYDVEIWGSLSLR